METLAKCLRCDRALSMRYAVRNARCPYCELSLLGASVWISVRHGADWVPARLLTLGRARGPITIVRVQLEDRGGLLMRAFTSRYWRDLRFRDVKTGGKDKPELAGLVDGTKTPHRSDCQGCRVCLPRRMQARESKVAETQ